MTLKGIVATIFLLSAAAKVPAANDTAVRITKSDCKKIVRNHPLANGSCQPGVDVHGRKVVPADVEAPYDPRNLVLEVIKFPFVLNALKEGVALFGETFLEVGKIGFVMNLRRTGFDDRPLMRTEASRNSKHWKERLG